MILFPWVVAPLTIPLQRFHFLCILTNTCYCLLLVYIVATLVDVKGYLIVDLTGISLMTNDAWASFLVLFGHEWSQSEGLSNQRVELPISETVKVVGGELSWPG